jgi:hypothetical protein
MRLKVSLILGCIILSLIPSSAFGAVKAGAKCSKAGQISISAGKQYTCLKKGKKLAWSAGKTITQAAPKPSATPTPTPTPEPSPSSPANTNPSPSSTPVPQPQPSKLVSANALAVQALFDEVWKRDTKSKAKYEIFIDPSRPNSKWAQEHVAFIETTLELLAKMGYDLKTSSKNSCRAIVGATKALGLEQVIAEKE